MTHNIGLHHLLLLLLGPVIHVLTLKRVGVYDNTCRYCCSGSVRQVFGFHPKIIFIIMDLAKGEQISFKNGDLVAIHCFDPVT